MTSKLIQKHLIKGTREFEIKGEMVHVHIKGLLKQEKDMVGLPTLNPEPVVNGAYLDFHRSIKPEPRLSLFMNKPDAEQFNAFVDALKQGIQGSHDAYAEVSTATKNTALAANIYEEPPEFGEFGQNRPKNKGTVVNAARVGESVELLEMYLDGDEIKPLIAALKELKNEPDNDTYLTNMENAFNNLGIAQGAVLTYAPYLSVLLADDPFNDK